MEGGKGLNMRASLLNRDGRQQRATAFHLPFPPELRAAAGLHRKGRENIIALPFRHPKLASRAAHTRRGTYNEETQVTTLGDSRLPRFCFRPPWLFPEEHAEDGFGFQVCLCIMKHSIDNHHGKSDIPCAGRRLWSRCYIRGVGIHIPPLV